MEGSSPDYWGMGYYLTRELPSGELAGLMRFLFTVGLVVGIDENGCYRTRFCYPEAVEAIMALAEWDGHGDPPGRWVVSKGVDGDRPNPGYKGS